MRFLRLIPDCTCTPAEIAGEILPQYDSSQKEVNPVSQFLSAYVPIVSIAPTGGLRNMTSRLMLSLQPLFLFLTFGYKLIKQTRMTPLDEMVFYRGRVPSYDPRKDEPKNWLERLLQWVRII